MSINHPDGLDANNCTFLALAIGDLPEGTRLHFRAVSWKDLPDGIPVIGVPDLAHFLLFDGFMDGGNVLAFLVAEIGEGDTVEFRTSGPDAAVVLDRIESAISVINERMPS